MKTKLFALAVLAATTVSQVAMAAPIDVADAVSGIAEQATPIGLVGGAVLLVVLAVKAFKWVRAALS